MSPIRHRMKVLFFASLAGVLGCVIAAGVWLSAWVPTKGKAWVETQLSQRLPLDVTIGRMRYSLWSGLLLEEVSAVDPKTSTLWFYAAHLTARLGWLPLLQQHVVFHLEGTLAAPCETDLVMAGRYDLRHRQLMADVRTSDLSIERMIPQLARQLPPALKAGALRLKLAVNWQPQLPLVLAGQIVGTQLIWEQGAVRFTSNLILDGTVTHTPRGPTPVSLTARLAQGRLDGLPFVKEAREVSGLLHLEHDILQIQSLHGITSGSPWQLEGEVALQPEPQADVVLRTEVDLATITTKLVESTNSPAGQDTAQAGWQSSGKTKLTVVCRGPLRQWPQLELMADAALQDASLTIPQWPHPVEHLAGHLRYDHLTHQLTIESLRGRVQDYPVTVGGSVSVATPAGLDLTIDTTADLALLKDLVPARRILQTSEGAVALHLDVGGTTAQPTWHGVATLSDVNLLPQGWTKTIHGLTGTIHFTTHEATTQGLSLMIDDQPIVLTGTLSDLATAPRLVCQAQLAQGSVAFTGTWHPDRLVIETAELARGVSRLRVQGQVGRGPHQPSQLTVTGILDMSDLTHLPWLHVKGLEAWQLEGETALHLQLAGSFDDWRMLSARALLRADHLSVRGLAVRAVNADVEQGQGRLAVRVAQAVVAGGRCGGEFLIDHTTRPPRSLLEFDLTNADLSQMAVLIPAWRERHIQGSLSAHASLMGSWADPASLRGDGWLRATGEHLAELPLLDRILRGFFGALANQLGLASFRRAQITEIAGQWRLAHARISTEDLRFSGVSGDQPMTIDLHGSVGLDHTLDLTVEPDLSEQLILEAPNTSTLARTFLKTVGGIERLRRLVGRHHLGGTIESPQYKFEFTPEQLLNQVLPAGLERLFESLR